MLNISVLQSTTCLYKLDRLLGETCTMKADEEYGDVCFNNNSGSMKDMNSGGEVDEWKKKYGELLCKNKKLKQQGQESARIHKEIKIENNNPILDTRISSVRPCVTLIPPPLDSETGWTGELWSNPVLLILEN